MKHIGHSRTAGRPVRSVHQGVSLLEVLISIGILSVGILGVASMVPLGHHLTQEGIRADRAAAIGRAAFREFKIRGWMNRDNWRPIQSFERIVVIDPIGYGPQRLDFPDDISQLQLESAIFRLDRTSIQAFASNNSAMPIALAQEIFMAQDGLAIDIPDDGEAPPLQLYTPSGEKRQTDGAFSWMATLTPSPTPPGQPATREMATLSIVVFYKRPLGASVNLDGPPPEQFAHVTFPSYPEGGLSGGDVILSAGIDNSGIPQTLDVKRGQWLLMYRQTVQGQVRAAGVWYKILEAELDKTNGRWDVTLQGADWPMRPGDAEGVGVAILDGVVTVYSKTIRIEGNNDSSLWSG